MLYLGNIGPGQTINFLFSTNAQSGAAAAPTTAGTVTVYQENTTTGTTTGVTYAPSFHSIAGVNLVTIDTSDDFYAAGSTYSVVLSGAVVDSQTVNAVLAEFAIVAPVPPVISVPYLGDFTIQQKVVVPFNSVGEASGDDNTIVGVMRDDELWITGEDKGITITYSLGDSPGINEIDIDTSANTDFTIGHDYWVGVLGVYFGDTPINAVVGYFSIQNRNTNANVTKWQNTTVPGLDTNGYVPVDVKKINGFSAGASGTSVTFPASVADAAKQPALQPQQDGSGYFKVKDDQGNALASKTDVQSIQNNTLCLRSVPAMIERPDTGTTTYRVELLLYDDKGNMAAPDAAPAIALVNQTGVDRSSRLDSATMSLVSTGRYRAVYTASAGDAIEQLVWTFSVVVGTVTRLYTNTIQVVDTTAVDFTSDDRSKLQAIYGKLPPAVPLQDGDGAFKVVDKQSGADLATAAVLGTPAEGHTVAADVAALAAALGTLTADERQALADAILARDVSHAEGSATRTSLATVVLAATNKANTVDHPGQLTVYRTDGVTAHAQIPISTDPHASPIDGVG